MFDRTKKAGKAVKTGYASSKEAAKHVKGKVEEHKCPVCRKNVYGAAGSYHPKCAMKAFEG